MKTDKSILNITIASVKRSSMDMDEWMYSYLSNSDNDKLIVDFGLEETEVPVFEIKSDSAHTLITTRRIIEQVDSKLRQIEFNQIDDVIFGNFKGRPNKPGLSKFRIVDLNGDELDFQLETGKASIGLMKSINTIRKLKAST